MILAAKLKLNIELTFNSTSPSPVPGSSIKVVGKPNSDMLDAMSTALILSGSNVTSALAAINAIKILFTPYNFLQCFSMAATQEAQVIPFKFTNHL